MSSRFLRTRLPLAWGMTALAAAGGALGQSVPQQRVEIIGTSPLPGQGVDRDALPYSTQLIRRGDIEDAQAINGTDLLARNAAGVVVDDVQGSPYQADFSFRGYRASGLMGAAQGLSVFLDGVRINEPFGDVVNWDLVPEYALSSIAIVPGANPAYGLNTLGGAIALTTLDGRSATGWRADMTLGSFGRRRLDVSQGGVHGEEGDWQHYVALSSFAEDGWRDHSPSRLSNLLAKVSRRTDAGEFGLSVLAGATRLVGNGLLPLDTLDEQGQRTPDLGRGDYRAIYTSPDITRNGLAHATLTWRLALDADSMLESIAYLRSSRRTTLNGDVADNAGEEGAPNASFNRTATRQHGAGAALGWSSKIAGHQLQLGANVDGAGVRYLQTEQAGQFNSARGVVPLEGEDAELSAAVRGRSLGLGLNASDTWRLAPDTHLTGTLRYNHFRISNTLTNVDDITGEPVVQPEESFTYAGWNPALGVSQRLGTGFTAFANIARNMRAPTVIELGCANPDEPCRLPAGLQSDPYLKPVRSLNMEAGLRWRGAGTLSGANASVTYYRTDNRDDILFSSVSLTSQLGYFHNFPRTRNQGVDAEWRWQAGAFDLSLVYGWLDATYQADGTLRVGERNVSVRPGTRIAGLPRQMLKLSGDWRAGPSLTLGADMQAFGSRTVSGNEDGRLADDGPAGIRMDIPGYAVLNLRAAGQLGSAWSWFANVTNVADRRYATYASLGQTVFDAQGHYTGEDIQALFVGPGSPRAFSAGLRMRY